MLIPAAQDTLTAIHHIAEHILVPRGRAPFGQHQESRPLSWTSVQVQQRKSAIHGLPVTLRMLRVKSDKSDWFWSQSIVFTNPFKTGMSLDLARGSTAVKWVRMLKPRARDTARVGMGCTFPYKQTSDKMAADLTFAYLFSFRGDKAETKQLRFLL